MMKENGFTLLELIIVIFLITVILAIAAVFFGTTLPSSQFSATAREMAAAMRHARAIAQIKGEDQTVTIDLDGKRYGIEDRSSKEIPKTVSVKIVDPVAGEILNGKYQFVFPAIGGVEGGTVVLWNQKRTISIVPDPIVGSVVIR